MVSCHPFTCITPQQTGDLISIRQTNLRQTDLAIAIVQCPRPPNIPLRTAVSVSNISRDLCSCNAGSATSNVISDSSADQMAKSRVPAWRIPRFERSDSACDRRRVQSSNWRWKKTPEWGHAKRMTSFVENGCRSILHRYCCLCWMPWYRFARTCFPFDRNAPQFCPVQPSRACDVI